MDYSMLEHATILFLVVVFIAAEVRRMRLAENGRIVGFDDEGVPLAPMLVTEVRVRLDNGEVVRARLDSCTACLGRFQMGDSVRVTPTRDGWTVDLSWLRRKNRRSYPGTHCRGAS
jgi:hypothetical protein